MDRLEKVKCNFYSMKLPTPEKLKSLGFTYNKGISDKDTEFYSYKFPVYKYKEKILLNCMISVETKSGYVVIDVYDVNLKQIYAPFYNNKSGYDKILSEINEKIMKKLDELEIKETN